MNHLAVTYGDQSIEVAVRRTSRTSMEIAVLPGGEVEVQTPVEATNLQVRRLVEKRARWILRQQQYFAQFRPRTPPRLWVPGETHRHLGRQYRLQIGDPDALRRAVGLQGRYIIIDGVQFADSISIERLIRAWRRAQMKVEIDRRLPECALRFSQSVTPASISIRRMSTRWASLSSAARLTVNPDLIQAPGDAIDYVLTHELAHLLVPHHGPAFWNLMDSVMPDHAARKLRLERATV